MRIKYRRSLPDEGELVVGDVMEVHDHGAYLELLEFPGVNAYLPWSEVATKAVRSIKEVLRPNMRVVVKVIRVYKGKGAVDVSLKRVMEGERRRKMMFYKRYAKAVALVLGLAEKMKKKEDEVYQEVIWKLEDAYGDPLTGLERAAIEGAKALERAGIDVKWRDQLVELAKTHVKPKTAKISGIFTIRTRAGDGVKRLKEVLSAIEDAVSEEENVKYRLYTIGAPRYRLDLEGYDYKTLESLISTVVERAQQEAKKREVALSFERIEE